MALIEHNAAVGAAIAVDLARLRGSSWVIFYISFINNNRKKKKKEILFSKNWFVLKLLGGKVEYRPGRVARRHRRPASRQMIALR